MFLIVGVLHLFAPQMMREPGIDLSKVNHLHTIRVESGDAYLYLAARFLLRTVKVEAAPFSLIAVAVLFSVFALGRIFSIAVDGVPVPLYLGALAAEVCFATLAALSLKKLTS